MTIKFIGYLSFELNNINLYDLNEILKGLIKGTNFIIILHFLNNFSGNKICDCFILLFCNTWPVIAGPCWLCPENCFTFASDILEPSPFSGFLQYWNSVVPTLRYSRAYAAHISPGTYLNLKNTHFARDIPSKKRNIWHQQA